MTSAAQRRAGADRGAEKSPHRAAEKAPVYEVLAEDIKAMGVEAVFGLMSDDTALFATSLDTVGVRFYGARHENKAIAMADGYAYATGRLGVAVIGRGPALANGLHAAVYASRTGLAVLIIYGEAATAGQPNGSGPTTRRSTASACSGRRDCARSRRRVHKRRAQVLADAAAAAMAGSCGEPASADQRAACRNRAARRRRCHARSRAASRRRPSRNPSRRQQRCWQRPGGH